MTTVELTTLVNQLTPTECAEVAVFARKLILSRHNSADPFVKRYTKSSFISAVKKSYVECDNGHTISAAKSLAALHTKYDI